MGCDVHPVIMVKDWTRDDGSEFWTPVGIPERNRNYDFFAYLAGVRGEEGPFGGPRGRFKNLDKSEAEYFLSGQHSESYVSLAELKANEPKPCPEDEKADGPREYFLWAKWVADMEHFRATRKANWGEDELTDNDVFVCFDFDS